MFRLLRPRSSAFSRSKLFLNASTQTQGGQAKNVQRVHFKKPGMRPRSIAVTALTVYVCYSIYSKVVLDPLEVAAQEALKNIPEDELDEEDEKPLFIPFPGTTKQLPPQPYRGSDPEWQEFIKFSKDQDLAKKVREELAGFVRQIAEKHPVLAMRCGKGMQLRRYWLDVDFPQHAPPEFERSGIEITDDYIAWTTMPVDSLTVFRIRQALWPSAVLQSFWSFTKVLIGDDVKRMAGMLGIRPASPPASAAIEQILARQQQILKGPVPAKDGSAGQSQTVTDATKALTGTGNSTLTGKGPEAGEIDPETKQAFYAQAHLIRAMIAFKMKLSQTMKPAPSYPPRGSILVSGLVELDSPRAWLVFDVRAAWDPRTKSYDTRTMHVALRRMQLKKQGPAGGR